MRREPFHLLLSFAGLGAARREMGGCRDPIHQTRVHAHSTGQRYFLEDEVRQPDLRVSNAMLIICTLRHGSALSDTHLALTSPRTCCADATLGAEVGIVAVAVGETLGVHRAAEDDGVHVLLGQQRAEVRRELGAWL
jgi:hypothetical protein